MKRINKYDLLGEADKLIEAKEYKRLPEIRKLMKEEARRAEEGAIHTGRMDDTSETKKLQIIDELIKFTNITDRKFHIECDLWGGLITLNNKMIVAPRSRKWRMKGRNKWYRYGVKQQEKLVKKYLLGENWNETN